MRWRDYLDADARNKVLASVVTGDLLSAYSFADHFSIRYAQIYRSAYVFSYFAAAGAVLLALSSLLLPLRLKPELLLSEIILIVAILLVIWRGGHNQWHRHWPGPRPGSPRRPPSGQLQDLATRTLADYQRRKRRQFILPCRALDPLMKLWR